MLNVTGTIMCFKNENEDGKITYRTTVGHRLEDGTYHNAGLMVRFPKGKEPADSGRIKILSAKLDHFKVEDNRPVFYLFVFEYQETDEEGTALNIDGQTMVFLNTKEDGKTYCRTTIGHKNADGTFDNAGITVRFPKGKEPGENMNIVIKSSKLDHFKVEDNRNVFYLFVFEYEPAPAA